MLDASIMRKSSCIKKVYRKLIQGYTLPILSSDIVFGSAFHTYTKVKEELGDSTKALASALQYYTKTPYFHKPKKSHLTNQYLIDTCMGHDTAFQIDAYDTVRSADGKPLVEQRIAYPFYVTPERDIEVLLCGTIDKIVFNRIAGYYAILDYKTTHAWQPDEYFKNYQLSTQLRMYKLLLTLYGKLFPDSIVAEITKGNLGAIIEGVFLAKDKSARYERSETLWFSEKGMEEFQEGIKLFIIQKLVPAIRHPNEFTYREGIVNGSCEEPYGGQCEFAESCGKETEEEREEFMRDNFSTKKYEPLTHGELAA